MVRLPNNVNVNLSISYLRRKTGRGCVALYNYGDVLCFTQDNRRIAYDWEAMKGESGDGR